MAIHTTIRYEYVNDKHTPLDVPRQVTTYEGRVLKVFNEQFRAMSDIYTMAKNVKAV